MPPAPPPSIYGRVPPRLAAETTFYLKEDGDQRTTTFGAGTVDPLPGETEVERPAVSPKRAKLDATEVEEVMPGGSKRAKVLRNLEKAMKKRRSILSKLRTAE